MITMSNAKDAITKAKIGVLADCFPFDGNYIARVINGRVGEENFDPFYVVDGETSDVSPFSLYNNVDLDALQTAFEAPRPKS